MSHIMSYIDTLGAQSLDGEVTQINKFIAQFAFILYFEIWLAGTRDSPRFWDMREIHSVSTQSPCISALAGQH